MTFPQSCVIPTSLHLHRQSVSFPTTRPRLRSLPTVMKCSACLAFDFKGGKGYHFLTTLNRMLNFPGQSSIMNSVYFCYFADLGLSAKVLVSHFKVTVFSWWVLLYLFFHLNSCILVTKFYHLARHVYLMPVKEFQYVIKALSF